MDKVYETVYKIVDARSGFNRLRSWIVSDIGSRIYRPNIPTVPCKECGPLMAFRDVRCALKLADDTDQVWRCDAIHSVDQSAVWLPGERLTYLAFIRGTILCDEIILRERVR